MSDSHNAKRNTLTGLTPNARRSPLEYPMRHALGLLVLFLMGATLLAEPPKIETRLRREGDSLTLRQRDKALQILITSKTGIGSAEIKVTEGSWPRDVTLRFEYAAGLGNGFKMLEGFTLTTDRLRVDGSHKQSGALPVYFPDADGNYGPDWPPAGHLRVTCTPVEGAMELVLPAHLLTGSRRVFISWVDAYRN